MNHNRATILVVDDNPTNLKLAVAVLESEGYRVEKAMDAEEAQRVIQEAVPDLILMDIALPGMDGLTLTRKLRADDATRHIRIVAMTAFAMKGDEQRAIEAGCNGYITKPIDTRRLPAQVAEFLHVEPGRPLNVLIVDDTEPSRKLLRVTLQAEGLNVFEAGDGVEALAVLERQSIDAIISDILMPTMDGYRLCYEVRKSERFHSLPFIFYTNTNTSPGDEKLAADLGANKFLSKPASAQTLLATLADVTAHRDRPGPPVMAPPQELELMKQYSSRLVAKLEDQNAELGRVAALLRESEAHFRAIVEHGGDAYFLMNAHGTVTLASPPTLYNLGYTKAEFVGRNAFEFVHPDDQPEMHSLFVRLLQEPASEVHCQLRGLHRDGSWRWLDAIGRNRLTDPNLAAIVVSYRDITERRHAEVALLESNERFQLVAKATNDAVWDWDLATDLGWWNEGVYALFGYQREQRPAESIIWNEHLHPEDRDRVLRGIQAVIDGGGQSWSDEYRILRADGSVAVIFDRGFVLRDSTGKAYRMIGAAQDITERKAAENQTRERERKLATLISNLPGAVFSVRNDPQYTAEYVSDQIAEITGYPAEDFRENRRNFGELMHPDDRDWAWNEVQKALGEHRPYEMTYRFIDAHGREKWNWERGRGIFAANGELQAVEGFVQDVTERKLADAALRQSEEFSRRIIESSYDCIKVLDLDGKLLSMSEGGQRLLGITNITPYLNQCWISFWKESDQPQVREAVAAGRAGNIGHFQAFCPSATGEPRWWDVIVSAIRDAAGQPCQLLSISRDITERKQAEEALHESDERLRLAVSAANVGLWDWDLKTNKVYFSPEWKRQIGYEEHEITNDFSEWESRVHPDDLEGALDIVRRYLANPWPYYVSEFRLRHKEGSYRWILAQGSLQFSNDGRPVRMLGSHVDITDRRRVEQELRESQASLEVAQEQARLGSWEYFPWLNRGTWSKQMYRLLNRDPALGPPSMDEFLQLLHPEDRPLIAQSMIQTTGEGTPGELDLRNNPELGPARTFHVHAEATSDTQGRLYFAGTLQDVTERKRSEDALRSSERELHDANVKLQVLSRQLIESQETERRQIARELHDEIGQILAAVSLRLQNLQLTCEASLRPQLAEDIAIVDQAIQQVRDLSLDLRPPTLDLLGLEASLRSLAEDHPRRTGVDVRFVGHLDIRLPQHLEIAGYRVVQAALTNVVRHAKARQAVIELRQVDHLAELIVRDDGIGFDVATVTRRALSGDSFGLLGMQERVELVGGSFAVDSKPGQGTIVRVSFPIPDDVN